MNTIHPANRLNNIQEYYFSKKLREVADMNAAGKNVISLGVGGPDLPPSEETIRELNVQAQKADVHGYQSYTGVPELRQGFAYFYRKWYGVALDPDREILPLIGSKEGVLHVSMTFLNAGDGVLIPNPGYPTYTSVSHLVEARIVHYDLLESNHWEPDFEALEKRDLSGVKLMWVNYPNMPTGRRATLELFEKLVAFGKKHNILICNDNPYSFILNDNRLSILSVEGAKDCCMEMNSMSKSHNMAGWRIGMLASNPQIVNWVLKAKSNVDSGMFKPVQLAAAKALYAGAEWYENINKTYARRRKLAMQIMDAIGCTYDEQQAGLFIWAKIPDTATSSEALADKILYEANVFLTPGFIFGSNGERYLRISLCAGDKAMEEALKRIKIF